MMREMKGNSAMENQEAFRNGGISDKMMEEVELIRKDWVVNEVIWAR